MTVRFATAREESWLFAWLPFFFSWPGAFIAYVLLGGRVRPRVRSLFTGILQASADADAEAAQVQRGRAKIQRERERDAL